MHKAVKALPVILRQCGVERGNIVKLLMRRGQRFKALAVVKLGHIARALEKIDLARIARFEQIENHRFGARQAGTAGDKNHILRIGFAHEKLPVRP